MPLIHHPLKIVVDNKIPYIREPLQQITDRIVYVRGAEITASQVSDADALIVRTRTRCNRQLLEHSRVQFIATATIGYDHIDTAYCREAGIRWSNAPGCNATSVAQYMQSVFLLLEQEKGKRLSETTLGIVGVGHVGSAVAETARALGMRVLLNDPPRAAREGGSLFCSLETLAAQCDIITFHVPLYNEGQYCTYHLCDHALFDMLKRRPILINTSRGEVVATDVLLKALGNGIVSDAVIDVWEHEPHPDLTLLNKVYIGTPHIAGYSADGKANATRMALDALCSHFGIQTDYHIEPPAPAHPVIVAASPTEAYLKIYDPRIDSAALKTCPDNFEHLRENYPLRREAIAFSIVCGK
ncbi:MAG: 4-phosphoerythronate dehydrogenase PdxB [Prevotellaceae bacterium]|jgi:erythronate-4-phosphate dehydrogenase|nr:4-phosphoerythronate dehydrogenase PdxB [Prevotellaceae bacterium]